MAKETKKSEIRREADAHIELGMLLRVPRKGEHKRAIERLLHGNLPVDDIIREIKRLDHRSKEAAEAKRDQSSEQSLDQQKPDQGPEQSLGQQKPELPGSREPLRHSISVIRSVIKMPFKSNSYLVFLFRELKRIRDFGIPRHIFLRVFFPPNIRFNDSLKRTFQKELVTGASELNTFAAQALELGWYYLEKRSYNLLVILKRLCGAVMDLRFDRLDLKDRNLIERLRQVETLFYILHYRKSYPDLIVSSLHRVLDRDPRFKGERDEISKMARRILFPEVMLPSLHNFLLGLNMLKYRRFLSIDDVICRDLGEIVNGREFGCDGTVLKRITEFIQDSRQKLDRLIDQRRETRRLSDYIPVTKKGRPDYSDLKRFYEGSAIANARYNFKADEGNVMLFAPRFLRVFENILFPLLCGRISLADGGRVRIFEKSFFPMDFPKLRQAATKLDKLAFTYRSFSKKRFFQVKDSITNGIPVELEIINLIDEAAGIMVQMGRKLEKILESDIEEKPEEGEAGPLGPIVLQGRAFQIPHGAVEIESRTVLNTKSVRASLHFAASICFTAAAYFQNLEELDAAGNLERLDLKIRSHLDVLERIADAVEFQEIQSSFAQSLQ